MTIKDAYAEYLRSTSVEGSGKASSYLRALELLEEMLLVVPLGFEDCRDIWSVDSVERIEALYWMVREQTRAWAKSPWRLEGIPVSYLRDGYCSAALRAYQIFLIEHRHQQDLLQRFREHDGDGESLVPKISDMVKYSKSLIDDWAKREGKSRLSEQQNRVGQSFFRSMILEIYQDTCCLTGIDLPQVNRASHILGWAESPETRMNPANGLCLSATYDAAFDKHLISFDEDYRLIVSREICEHYHSDAVKTHFVKRQGQRLMMPTRFPPDPVFLAQHRDRLVG